MLDDPIASSLDGAHAHLAIRRGAAARYPEDVATFASLAGDGPEAWADLADLVGPGGAVGMCGLTVPQPPIGGGLVEQFRMAGRQYVCDAPVRLPSGAQRIDLRPLEEADWPEMIDLVALAQPGPFRARTPILGHYLGVRVDGRLLAMAGERLHPAGATEISAVCTHPSARRRGYAAALTAAVAAQIQGRGELPFLHVAVDNVGAQSVYEGLGFELRADMEFVGVARP